MTKLTELYLARRGLTYEDIKKLNDPAHDILMDVPELSLELLRIKSENRHIVVLSDFDMDGIVSGIILYAGLCELGFYVSLYQPRVDTGYGFDSSDIDSILDQFPDVYAIITCDVGISCYDGVRYAKSRGVKVFVTDHHKEDDSAPEQLLCDYKVNPNRVDETYSNKGICGAFVAYQLLEYYADKYESVFIREQIRRLRVFAGIGTVSDNMPLLYENRELVKDCISILKLVYCKANSFFVDSLRGSYAYVTAFKGLYDLLVYFSKQGKLMSDTDINEFFIGYYLAPLFNSIKRMDGDIYLAFGTFFSDERQKCFDSLWELNEKRKDLVALKYRDMMMKEQPYAPYIYVSDAPRGVLGLLATKVINDTGLPVFVVNFSVDQFAGSGRAPVWFSILDEMSGLDVTVGGHQGACGISFDFNYVDKLYDFMKCRVDELLVNLPKTDVQPDIKISLLGNGDTGIDIALFMEFIDDLRQLSPFGRGFEPPVCCLEFTSGDAVFSVMGSLKQHLKIILPMGFTAIIWNGADLLSTLKSQDVLCLAGSLSINRYFDKFSLNFIASA